MGGCVLHGRRIPTETPAYGTVQSESGTRDGTAAADATVSHHVLRRAPTARSPDGQSSSSETVWMSASRNSWYVSAIFSGLTPTVRSVTTRTA